MEQRFLGTRLGFLPPQTAKNETHTVGAEVCSSSSRVRMACLVLCSPAAMAMIGARMVKIYSSQARVWRSDLIHRLSVGPVDTACCCSYTYTCTMGGAHSDPYTHTHALWEGLSIRPAAATIYTSIPPPILMCRPLWVSHE